MLEYLASLMVAITVGLFYWWKVNRSFWVSSLIIIWCLVGPDVPKVFLNNPEFVNIGGWCFALLILVFILSKSSFGKKSYLIPLLFIEVGLVLHLTVDYIFKGGVV